MKKELILFLSALQFFTRIPVPHWVGHSPEQLNQSARYFPLVGLVAGLIAAMALIIAAQLLPLSVALLLSMALSILMTGAFHEDGVSDYADGMGGGFTRERVLAIMKDSRIGSYGAITIAMVLLIKFQTLNEIGLRVEQASAVYAVAIVLMVGHITSRFAAIMVMRHLNYIRDDADARAKPAANRLSTSSMLIAFATTIGAIFIAMSAWRMVFINEAYGNLFYVLASAFICTLLMWAYMVWRLRVRLGGYTGDCLGAIQQLCELAFYLGWLGALSYVSRHV